MKKLNDTVIKSLTREHGTKVIQWWKAQGVDTRILQGSFTEKENDNFIYYGLINNEFNNYSLEEVQEANAKIIELPIEDEIPTLGKGVLMEVSKYVDFKHIEKRFIIGKTNKYYIVWPFAEEEKDIDYNTVPVPWKYARPIKAIPKHTIEELTKIVGYEFEIVE